MKVQYPGLLMKSKARVVRKIEPDFSFNDQPIPAEAQTFFVAANKPSKKGTGFAISIGIAGRNAQVPDSLMSGDYIPEADYRAPAAPGNVVLGITEDIYSLTWDVPVDPQGATPVWGQVRYLSGNDELTDSAWTASATAFGYFAPNVWVADNPGSQAIQICTTAAPDIHGPYQFGVRYKNYATRVGAIATASATFPA